MKEAAATELSSVESSCSGLGWRGLQVGLQVEQRWSSSELQDLVELGVEQRWSSSELHVELQVEQWWSSMEEIAAFGKEAAGSGSGSAASEGSELQVELQVEQRWSNGGAAMSCKWSSGGAAMSCRWSSGGHHEPTDSILASFQLQNCCID